MVSRVELLFVLQHFFFSLIFLSLLLLSEVSWFHYHSDLISGPLVSIGIFASLYCIADCCNLFECTTFHDLLVQLNVVNEFFNTTLVCFIPRFLSKVKHVINLFSRFFDLSLCNFLVIFELHLKVSELILHLLLDILLGLTF